MDLSNLPQYLQVVLGIGLVIFVHESGHFLAARLCKVRVHVFSLGFGPRLLAWRRGHTTFQIAAIPLGGYVRMAGDEELGRGQRTPEPWELGAKSVPQRFLIYSGGVIMNVLFGVVVFPILFLVGLPSLEPRVGQVEPGSPAWYAELPRDAVIHSVNGKEIYDLIQVGPEVAYGGDSPVELEISPPGSETRELLRLEPEYDELLGVNSIGRISPALTRGLPLVIEPGSPADEAGLREGDRLLAVAGWPEALPAERQLALAVSLQEPLQLEVARGEERVQVTLEPESILRETPKLMGVRPLQNRVRGVRSSELVAATGIEEGDVLLSVNGARVEGPASLLRAVQGAEGDLHWLIEREERQVHLTSPALADADAEAVALCDDLALVHDEEGTRVMVLPGTAAAEAGLRSGDRIERIDGVVVRDYAEVREAARSAAARGRALRVTFSRPGPEGSEPLELTVTPGPYPVAQYGLALEPARYDYRVTNVFKAISLGTVACYDMLRDVWRTLRGVLTREVSGDNLGGIISIGVVANQTAEEGLERFFWFLCILSMNLAFLNVLPIPLLDGGHLFFLLVEGIKGSPVNERILSYSQLVGLVLIVSIFVFVIYNDLNTHIFN